MSPLRKPEAPGRRHTTSRSPGIPLSLPHDDHSDRFPATRWSLVLTASGKDEPAAARAFEELCQIYWYPIYCYVRNRGHTPEDAEDLTQEFFAMLIEREALTRADASRGKLRSYLLNAVKHFLIDRHRRRSARKRGGGVPLLSIDAVSAEKRLAFDPIEADTPESAFDRTWARALLDRVRDQLEDAYRRADKAQLFAALEPYVTATDREPPYLEIASRLNASAGSLRVAAFRLRQKYRQMLESEIADTLSDRAEINGEISYLLGLFAS
jgi:RNA polymerase sigma-70 factor (ECF subfamily)